MEDQYKLIDTEINGNGQTKCPKCGSTDISQNHVTGKLRCNFCRYEFEPELAEESHNICDLEGTNIYKGASNIIDDHSVTLKCESCGAEVVIDTSETTQARCHWCRNTLSINDQIPNGAVPDVILPFWLDKEDAEQRINEYVGKRKFFANTTFRKEFTTENICGVYFPYMIVDLNGHATFEGQGEIETDRYEVGDKDHKETRYDADLYSVGRDFDIEIDDLCIESSSSRLDLECEEETNNIINAVMPFDTESCIKYDSNYLRGYTSEKRDTNIDDLKETVYSQAKDIAKISAKDTLDDYDRGVRWDYENFKSKGDLWKTAYLPVWLYSYLEQSKSKNTLHYVAVNARTGETVGSIPLNKTKLLLFSFLIELFSFFAAFLKFPNEFYGFRLDFTDLSPKTLILLSGFIFYSIIFLRYRNLNARHKYEEETDYNIKNMKYKDNYLTSLEGLDSPRIENCNYSRINSRSAKSKNGITNFISDFKADNIRINGINLGEVLDSFKGGNDD